MSQTMNQPLVFAATDETRQAWLEKDLGSGYQREIAAANVLIVPERYFRDGVKYVFFQDTIKLLNYLQAGLNGQLTVEICSNDDEYLEIALHSATFRISKIFTTVVAVPLVVGLLTNYIYDELKAKPTDVVELSIVVEDHDCKSFEFKYKGEARDLNQLSDKVGQLVRDCQATLKKRHRSHEKPN
jgi:hypothetical protein